MALKNFNVMVPTFQVKGKHICSPREVRHRCFPVLILNVHLLEKLVNVSQVKNEPLLSISLDRHRQGVNDPRRYLSMQNTTRFN